MIWTNNQNFIFLKLRQKGELIAWNKGHIL